MHRSELLAVPGKYGVWRAHGGVVTGNNVSSSRNACGTPQTKMWMCNRVKSFDMMYI